MKYLKGLLVICVGLCISISCGDSPDASDAWKEDRDQLSGAWEGTATYTRKYEDSEVQTGERLVSIRLASEGIAVVGFGTFSNSFEWYYQPDPETILLSSIGSFVSSGYPSVIDVIENNESDQLWETRFSNYESRDSVWVRYDTDEIWTLSRQ